MIWISHRPGRESNRRIRAILQQELIQGRKLASQLQTMLRSSSSNSSSSPESPSTTTSVVVVEDLAEQIMATFNESLSMLDFAQISDFDDDHDDDHHHGSEIIPAAHVNLHDDDDDQVGSAVTSYWDHGTAGKSHQDSSISECSKTSVAPPKDRRGCYKRRRKTSLTSEKVTPNFLDDDGHAWRKYGQKQILNAKHPRNYYRCTHKYEQGCKATKQVQRIDDQDAPPMYKTTYHDHHTCRNPPLILNPPPADHHHQIILDSSSTRDSSSSSTLILNFESKVILGKKPEDDSYTMIKHDIFDHDEHYCNAKEEEEAAEELDNSQSCTMYQYPDHDSSVQLTAAPSGSSDYLITTSGLQQIMNAAEPLPMHANMIPAEQEESISGVLYSYTPSCTTLDHPRSIGILDHDMTVGTPNFDDINEFEF